MNSVDESLSIDAGMLPVNTNLGLSLRSFSAMLVRDILVGAREIGAFLLMFLLQPLLYLFVFGRILPTLELASDAFTQYVAPGIVALGLFIAGMQSTAFRIGSEFGWTREIDDRLLSPLPRWLVAVEKMTYGTLQASIAAVIIMLLGKPVLGTWPGFELWRWDLLVAAIIIGGLAASSLGLAVGTVVKASNIGVVFSLVFAPMMFLGGPFYPWMGLDKFPILQKVALINPLLYVSEIFRAAMVPNLPYMPLPLALTGALVSIGLFCFLGIRGFFRRVRG